VCYSYYFPGALGVIYPPPNAAEGQTDVIIAHDVQAMQVDFWDADEAEIKDISLSDCRIYGGSLEAFGVCIVPSSQNASDHLVISMTSS
jgi:hypothetical protein